MKFALKSEAHFADRLVQCSVKTTYYTVNGHCSCRPANIGFSVQEYLNDLNVPSVSVTLVYKNKYYFSVTSTKVGELNSIFYAEFKFVLSFSISRKVFK
jgi:uncharacterized membrane protein